MIMLEYNNKHFKVLNSLDIEHSSRQVTFNEVEIDFTDYTIEDLPVKYQEVKIGDYNCNNGVYSEIERLFTGYVDTFDLPEIKFVKLHNVLKLELLSPMSMTSLRSISAIGTYYLQDLIKFIIQPLINDGFTLIEMNIGNPQISVNYLLETIECCLNRLSNKYNFWWNIDQNKGIYINSIDYQFSKKPVAKLDNVNKLPNLFKIVPSMEATDYCNVINFVNLRMYNYSADYIYSYRSIDIPIIRNPLFDKTKKIKKDDTIDFNHPIDITYKNIIKSYEANGSAEELLYITWGKDSSSPNAFKMDYEYSDKVKGSMYIRTNRNNESIEFSNNIGFSGEGGEETMEFELIRDSFFPNLITGFKYNGDKDITINSYGSASCLTWTRLKFLNETEINKCKEKVSLTGQIEKIIDMNEQWKTISELREIASSYININGNQTDLIKLSFKNAKNTSYDFSGKVGDIISINQPEYYADSNYIITDIKISYSLSNKILKEWEVSARNANYLENYIDLFRSDEEQEIEEKNYILVTSNFENDGIKEIHEVT